MRRAACGLLKDAGVDAKTIQKWVGWESEQMVSRYDQRNHAQRQAGAKVISLLEARQAAQAAR